MDPDELQHLLPDRYHRGAVKLAWLRMRYAVPLHDGCAHGRAFSHRAAPRKDPGCRYGFSPGAL